MLLEDRVLELIRSAGLGGDRETQIFRRLKEVTFLGLETRPGVFEFAEAGHSLQKASVLARKNLETSGAGSPLVSVHPAYRSYLELQE